MTLAGKVLFITQPAVSRLIIELEHEIGFKLFERRKSRLTPTPEAEILFEEVEKSFIGLQELSQTAESIRVLHKGYLRVIAMPGFAHLMLPKVMERFWERYPNINAEIESHPRTVVLDWIHSRQYDLGIANLPIDNSEVQVHNTFDVPMVCVMPEGHRLAEKECVSIQDFNGENFVSFPLGTYVRHSVENIFAQNQVRYRLKLSTRSTADIYHFVRYGAGISLVFPFDQFDETIVPGLVFRPVDIDFYMTIGVLHSRRRKPSIAAENFIQVMNEFTSR
jgi:DNA-binding transcriptional LysR family regulator